MSGDLLLFWSIAFWKASESVSQNSSLISCSRSIYWSQIGTFLPFVMLITRLIKLLKFDLSGERSIAPSIDINNTLFKRMHVGEHAPVSQPPPIVPPFVPGSSLTSTDPYIALSAQFLKLSEDQFLAWEDIDLSRRDPTGISEWLSVCLLFYLIPSDLCWWELW